MPQTSTTPDDAAEATVATRPPLRLLLLDALRGGLMGVAELLPGISGGTVALITGIYERLINGASSLVVALKRLVTGPDRLAGFAAEARRVDWWLVVPAIIGMAAVIFTVAGPVEQLVSDNPELSRGLFLGLVAASIAVPLRLLPAATGGAPRRVGDIAMFVAAAALAFVLTGLAGSNEVAEPSLWFVAIAAAVAVCALVVPGISGSFFLLAVGLYAPTLRAVDERDWGYIGVFALGALVGLVTIVRVVSHLLERHRRLTLIAMAGLMLGSLRALWPWQATSGDGHGVGTPVAPTDPVWGPIILAIVGAAVVIVMIIVENHMTRLKTPDGSPSLDVD